MLCPHHVTLKHTRLRVFAPLPLSSTTGPASTIKMSVDIVWNVSVQRGDFKYCGPSWEKHTPGNLLTFLCKPQNTHKKEIRAYSAMRAKHSCLIDWKRATQPRSAKLRLICRLAVVRSVYCCRSPQCGRTCVGLIAAIDSSTYFLVCASVSVDFLITETTVTIYTAPVPAEVTG